MKHSRLLYPATEEPAFPLGSTEPLLHEREAEVLTAKKRVLRLRQSARSSLLAGLDVRPALDTKPTRAARVVCRHLHAGIVSWLERISPLAFTNTFPLRSVPGSQGVIERMSLAL